MRKFVWMLGCALLLGLASRVPAQAQGDLDLTRNWDLRAGFFLPERQSVRSAGGDVFFTIGAERSFYEVDRYQGTIGIDYYGSGSIYNVPITINVRSETGRLRLGGGMGVGLSHDTTRGQTAFTWNLLVGYILRTGTNQVFADLRYMALSGGGDLNGWAFTLGYHF